MHGKLTAEINDQSHRSLVSVLQLGDPIFSFSASSILWERRGENVDLLGMSHVRQC